MLGGPVINSLALVQLMAWRRIGDKPLSELMLTRVYVTAGGDELRTFFLLKVCYNTHPRFNSNGSLVKPSSKIGHGWENKPQIQQYTWLFIHSQISINVKGCLIYCLFSEAYRTKESKLRPKKKKRVQGYFAKINAKIRQVENKVFICCEILRYMFIYVYKQKKNGKAFCVMPYLQTICRLKLAFQNVD